MSRHTHTAAGERVASLKAARAELAVAYGLLETDPRIGQAALVKLNQQNWERDVLVGRPVPNSELQAYTNVVSQLLGPPAVPLNIHFIDGSDVCVTCRGPLPPRSERVPVEPAAAPVEVPPPTAPASIRTRCQSHSAKATTAATITNASDTRQLLRGAYIRERTQRRTDEKSRTRSADGRQR